MGEEQEQRRGRHAVDPAGMGEGRRTMPLQLLGDLVGKAADIAEIHIRRDMTGLLAL